MPRVTWFDLLDPQDLPYESDEEEAEVRELVEIVNTSRRGSTERRGAIDRLTQIRRQMIARDRWMSP